jgi:fucose permease
MSRFTRNLTFSLGLIVILLGLPSAALAHGGDESEIVPFAGPLSWAFMGFGALVIAGVGSILFSKKSDAASRSPAHVESIEGLRGYIARMRLFSRNARLYMIHVVGMDVIHGTWEVVFNLYLLAVGFDVAFVGLRILVRSISVAAMSIPAGLISDRIGRKLSFILGDGVGALTSLVAISTANPALILGAAVMAGLFGSLHGVSEPAFMAENSEDHERVHLFSVADGTRTAAAIIGSALCGFIELSPMGELLSGLLRLSPH